MSLIIATGSNLGDRKKNLELALIELEKVFTLVKASNIFASQAVDYTGQPDFLNQVLEFELPKISPIQALDRLLSIESKYGRTRIIDKGPRTLDIDLIFWGLENINISPKLVVPHPSWQNRSFVVRPLLQLPFRKVLEKHFTVPEIFDVEAFPIDI